MRKAQDWEHHTKLRVVHNISDKNRMLQTHQKRMVHNIADNLVTVHTMPYKTRMVHTIPDDPRMV